VTFPGNKKMILVRPELLYDSMTKTDSGGTQLAAGITII
jgi:hypothetical protein